MNSPISSQKPSPFTPAAALAAGLILLATTSLRAAPATLTVDVDHPGHKVSPTLWGVFFEDINLSTDGGIYPELVRNRSFEDAETPENWRLVNGADGRSEMAIDSSRPLNPLNRRSLRLRLEGAASLVNEGYWGMNFVKGEGYQVRLAARAEGGFRGPIKVRLESKSGNAIAQGEINGLTDQWKKFSLDLSAADTDPNGGLVLTTEGKGTLWLDMVSVMPKQTWRGHGLRPDLCEMLDGLKPSFVRFPGGCWVEGDDMAHMNHWKNTIGDPAYRIPLWNIWGYWATHGLGFHEYLEMAEDLGAEPLFCINVGMSHREVVPMDLMGQWVQDALDAIEYANGPTNTVWGALRARNGHPAPFNLKYMEIGNENGGPAYHERYAWFYHAIKAKYPEMHLVADEWGGIPKDSPVEIVDEHYYNTPEFFIQQSGKYDTYDRDGPKVFVGEYAVTQNCGKGNLRGAIGEATFMLGLERNSDVVIMASYAPLFVNLNHRRWNPDLINFDSSRVYGLPSYYVQQMFSQNRGDVVLPVTLDVPTVAPKPRSGAIGVGTWLTQAEFKDIKVTRDGQTLFAQDLTQGTQGWRFHGGDWKVQDGALRQTVIADNIRAFAGDKSWNNYTYTLKARKLGGDEGFLISFLVQDEDAKAWWNIGGWGNSRHALELDGVPDSSVPGHIETGRWYDIRVEVNGANIKCYLDGKLVHNVTAAPMKSLYASATRDQAHGEVIVKVVNVSADPQPAEIRLAGITKAASPARALRLSSAEPTDENSVTEPTKVAPVARTIPVSGATLSESFPGNSFTVIRVKVE